MNEKNTNQSNFKKYYCYCCDSSCFLFCWKSMARWRKPTAITSDLLSQQIQGISELASVEYNYTNMGKYENQATFMVGKSLLQQRVSFYHMMEK